MNGADDPVSDALQRLRSAGLIRSPVLGLHHIDDDDGNEVVEVSITQGASDAEVAVVRGALAGLYFVIVRRPAAPA